MEKEKLKSVIILIFGIIIFGLIIYTFLSIESYSQENYIFKTILKADNDFSKISIVIQKAERFYDEASYSYEDGNYNLVESNCRLSREYYSEGSQGYRKIKAELKSKEIEDKLIYIYFDILNSMIKITDSMFEACEYFESASRYYNMEDYAMGGGEIDFMSKKIRDHDEEVEIYNNLLEEFKVELEKRIIK